MKSYVNLKGFTFRLVFPYLVAYVLFISYGDACETLPSSIHIIKGISFIDYQFVLIHRFELELLNCSSTLDHFRTIYEQWPVGKNL